MAEHPELWRDRTPEQRPPTDLTSAAAGASEEPPDHEPPDDQPADDQPADDEVPRRQRRERGPFLTYLRLPWSYGDRESSDVWHRLQCRLGRHQMDGGHTMQVGGTLVFIERRCRWCDT